MSIVQAEGSPKVGAKQVVFKIDVGEDISAATSVSIDFLKPNGSVMQKIAYVENTYYVRWSTMYASDLGIAGLWKGTVFISKVDYEGYTDTFTFAVLDRFG